MNKKSAERIDQIVARGKRDLDKKPTPGPKFGLCELDTYRIGTKNMRRTINGDK